MRLLASRAYPSPHLLGDPEFLPSWMDPRRPRDPEFLPSWADPRRLKDPEFLPSHPRQTTSDIAPASGCHSTLCSHAITYYWHFSS